MHKQQLGKQKSPVSVVKQPILADPTPEVLLLESVFIAHYCQEYSKVQWKSEEDDFQV